MNTKKMTAFIVGAMLIATVLVIAVSAAGMDREDYLGMPRMVYEFDAATDTGIYINDVGPTEPTLRIYGEEDAVYPTQSYTEADDFVYPDPVDAFDPGVIAKDSVTFNPAYIHGLYKGNELMIDNGNADEKAFLRIFYDPGYDHVIDAKMKLEYPNELRELDGVYKMPNGALVTETTYMLVKYSSDGHSGLPKAGAAGYPGNSPTEFMLPINSLDGTVPGMDNAQVVELTDADFGGSLTEGEIEVSMTWDSVSTGAVRNFMDHKIKYKGTDADGNPLVDAWYVGNMQNRHDERRNNVEFVEGQKTYIDRHNQISPTTTPRYRWFINVQNILGNDDCKLTLGRRLVAGETFYVDGVRYDMPAIYVTEDGKFKYITFQSPLPKCNGPMWANDDSDQWDWSHVPSQWLANLVPQKHDGGNANNVANVWVLPPFNEDHTMIDDIGIEKESEICTGSDIGIDSEAGNILGIVGELEFNYLVELTEDRFDTSLAERHARKDGVEIWNWWSVFTKPYQYTELVLPNQETTAMADGNEYLVTTSFIAPNCEDEEREKLCKSDVEVHDIIDRTADITESGDSSRDAYLNMPRMAFEFDAFDCDDLFVNGIPGEPLVRIYGEEGAIYPTQSFTGVDDFIYPNHVDAFDPGVIAKDSATFNPAYIHSSYKNRELMVSNGDADEKVFYRVFYDPGYAHGIDAKMAIEYPSELRELDGAYKMPNGALVTETTYMLVRYSSDGHSGLPKAGSAGEPGSSPTEFMLPINSLDGTVPGMDNARVVELTDADFGGSLTEGEIEVSMTWDSVSTGAVRNFMDHKIKYKGTDADGNPLVDAWYVGNMQNRHDERRNNVEFVEGQKTYIDRHNQLSPTTTTPRYRWFINVQNILGDDKCKLTLGRRLVAGETFYVDGVRYDMPAIYVTDDDKFKYITFQSPLPKCDGPMWANDDSDQWDWSHVPSQWLANLVPQEYDGGNANNVANVWVLPPFNDNHTMIDDIGIEKESEICTGSDIGIDSEAGNILGIVGELEFNYTIESTEDRFDTSLAERHAYDESSNEIWNWWSIFTKPYQYTELVLPNQETTKMADGNEYLIATSFIAPNCEDEEREELCKSDIEVHDIIDRAFTGPVPIDCPWDLNDDGFVNNDDVLEIVLNWGACSGCDEDLNGDGFVNNDDVLEIVLNWGACP